MAKEKGDKTFVDYTPVEDDPDAATSTADFVSGKERAKAAAKAKAKAADETDADGDADTAKTGAKTTSGSKKAK